MKKAIYLSALIAPLLLNNIWASTPAETNNNNNNKPKQELPYSFKHKLKTNNKVVAQIIDPQAAYNKFLKEKNQKMPINFYLGVYDKFSATLDSSGTWENLANGDRVWRLKISTQSNLITGMGIHSSKMQIPQGGKLFFYSDDKKSVVGPVTEPNQKSAKQLLVNTIAGKTIWVEYYEPKAQKGKSTFNIDALLYRFVAFPYGVTHKLKKKVDFVNPYPKSEQEEIESEMPARKVGKLAGGEKYTDYTLDNSGVWENLPNGDRVWRMGIETNIGFALSLRTKIEIPQNAYLSFYTPDGLYVSSNYLAPINSYNNELYPSGLLGNKIIVEYYEPKEVRGKGSVQILWVEIDLTKWTASLNREEQDEGEPTCIPNIPCDCDDFSSTNAPDFCTTDLLGALPALKNTVVRIRMFFKCTNPAGTYCTPEPGGTGNIIYNNPNEYHFCTGTLLNNTDCKPYIISAGHCLKNDSSTLFNSYHTDLDSTVYFRFDFNFDSPACNESLLPNTPPPRTLEKGATLVATSVQLGNSGVQTDGTGIADFLLLELKENIPTDFDVAYAGWNASQDLPSKGISISHPQGYDKRYALQDDAISLVSPSDTGLYNGIRPFWTNNPDYMFNIPLTNDNNNNGSYFGVTFDRGAVLAGSSGSGYFNKWGELLGTLSGGTSGCEESLPSPSFPNGNNNQLAHYGRLWYSYDKIPTGNLSTQMPINITAPNSQGGASITPYEKRHTLSTWLMEPLGSMSGATVDNCEIYMRDNPWDTPNNEPNNTALIDNAWQAIWESPDLWNTTINKNIIVNSANAGTLLSPTNQEPEMIQIL